MKQSQANLLVTLLAILIHLVGFLNSVVGSRDRAEPAAFPAPLEFGAWHASRDYTGFQHCMEQHQTPKMLSGNEPKEGIKEWCLMVTQPTIDLSLRITSGRSGGLSICGVVALTST